MPTVPSQKWRLARATEWSGLVETFAHKADTLADFTERRYFPFKKDAVELKGEVRVSGVRGLSLHYTAPEDRTVILDEKGILIRVSANEALLHVLRFDFAALEKDFELYGQRDGEAWTLALVPRTAALRRSVGRITVSGDSTAISRIEIRRSAKQAILISMEPPKPAAAFTDEELKKFFR